MNQHVAHKETGTVHEFSSSFSEESRKSTNSKVKSIDLCSAEAPTKSHLSKGGLATSCVTPKGKTWDGMYKTMSDLVMPHGLVWFYLFLFPPVSAASILFLIELERIFGGVLYIERVTI